MTDQEIEDHIRQSFEDNFETLKFEGGHSLAPEMKELALNQVLMYWRRLRDVASRVTETEVKLSLPGRTTPKGKSYTIEGVVDIVREESRVVMYDVKTLETDIIQGKRDEFERQLNVYAHIWQSLHNQPLHEMAIICTHFSDEIRIALREGAEERLAMLMQRWDPLIPIPFDPDHIDRTVEEFGEAVDRIEDGDFEPPSPATLRANYPGTRVPFGTYICRNCDARFSCDSYRDFMRDGRGGSEARFRKFVLQDYGEDGTRDDRRVAEIDQAEAQNRALRKLV